MVKQTHSRVTDLRLNQEANGKEKKYIKKRKTKVQRLSYLILTYFPYSFPTLLEKDYAEHLFQHILIQKVYLYGNTIYVNNTSW